MKYRLMSPGPTPIPESVLAEMSLPILHHRTPQFEAVVKKVRAQLKWLCQTNEDVLMLCSSGTGAMEASIVNTCSLGDRVLVVNGGKFGERFALIAKAYQLTVDTIDLEWGESVTTQQLSSMLEKNSYRALFVQASETSTGTCHPIQDIGTLLKNYPETLFVVDAITALGVMPLPFDEYGIDIMIGGSQKALMLPPGLAIMALSQKAWQHIKTSQLPKFYFDLIAEKKAQDKNSTAWTPAVTHIMGLSKVLDRMQEEGLENISARHFHLAEALRQAVHACHLSLLPKTQPSNSVTAIKMPETLNADTLIKILRDEYNITIAEGQDHLKGKIFRIGHLGYYDQLDMITVWSAVEATLERMGHQFTLGSGINAMIRYFNHLKGNL